MYDHDWARRIVMQFRRIRTRTNSLDYCIIETARDLYPDSPNFGPIEITNCLIRALQHRSKGEYWRAYQKLQKKSPLDMESLVKVARFIVWEIDETRTEALQNTFDFY